MKKLCDGLMKLNPVLPFGNDYSTLALALFFQEKGFFYDLNYSLYDYTVYLYRFYSDIEKARKNHYYKLINEISHYRPEDMYEYSKSILKYVEDNIGLIHVYGDSFRLTYCPDNIEKNEKILKGIIQTLLGKFLGTEYRLYDSRISRNEVKNKKIFYEDSRVFYRAMEVLNYCFITDEFDVKKLCAVRLKNFDCFKENNYLILKKEYGDMFISNRLEIRRNGYPYLDGKRMYEHIEISALKKIRDNLK